MPDSTNRGSVPEPLRRRALEIYRRLRALAIDLYREQGGTPGEADSFDLQVTVELGRLRMQEALGLHGEAMLGDLLRKTGELAASLSAFRAGSAYCFFCQQSSCPHSEPPSAASAFAGYLPTGRPRWVDFPSLTLEWRDPRVEAVFSGRPEVIALFRSAPSLTAQLLPDFRMNPQVYDLVGEVVIGPLPIGDSTGTRHAETAGTIQAVRCLGRDGESEIRLNLIGKVPGHGDLRVFLGTGGDEALARAIAAVEREFDSINQRTRGVRRAGKPAGVPAPVVEAILRRLARRIEQIYRQRGRRTLHAQARTEEGVRPTRKALEDARCAAPDRVLVDEKGGTLVVLGPKGRVHVFSPTGRLVTSLSARREDVQRRIERRRWRLASALEVAAFRSAIAPTDGER